MKKIEKTRLADYIIWFCIVFLVTVLISCKSVNYSHVYTTSTGLVVSVDRKYVHTTYSNGSNYRRYTKQEFADLLINNSKGVNLSK